MGSPRCRPDSVRPQMKHVCMLSSGVGSWAMARRVRDRHGTDNLYLLFTDVKGSNPSPHAGEDEDNYRFLDEAIADIGGKAIRINTGRDIYDVFDDEHMLGNSWVAPCSRELKQKPARDWLDANCDPPSTIIYVGIDWTEAHRTNSIESAYSPYRVEFPMLDKPYLAKHEVRAWAVQEGLTPARLYDYGFLHANCGGFCVRMGHAQAKLLLRTNPERFAYHEQREQDFRDKFGFDAAFLKYRSGPKEGQPMTMRELREAVAKQPTLFDDEPMSGCDSCFTHIDDG